MRLADKVTIITGGGSGMGRVAATMFAAEGARVVVADYAQDAGQATIDKVAGPIGEALVMTALGLAVAIPAVLGYNALVRGNKSILHKLNRFAFDLHAYFVTGSRVSAKGGTRVVAMRKGG